MQDCSESDPSAALSNNGCTKFVNFTILLEKPIACQSVVFSNTKDPHLQFFATGLFTLQLHVILVVNNCCVSL